MDVTKITLAQFARTLLDFFRCGDQHVFRIRTPSGNRWTSHNATKLFEIAPTSSFLFVRLPGVGRPEEDFWPFTRGEEVPDPVKERGVYMKLHPLADSPEAKKRMEAAQFEYKAFK